MARWFDKLKSSLGFGAISVQQLEERISGPRMSGPRVMAPIPLSLQVQRIGGGVTPAQVSEILRLADLGYIYRLVDLANDARQKDCHLQSVLQTREIAVQGLPWQVVPAKGGKRLRDKKICEFVEDALRGCLGTTGTGSGENVGFEELIGHLIGGDYYGLAVSETTWEKASGRLVPTCFTNHAARRFIFDLEQGRLRWWDAMGSGSKAESYPGIDIMSDYPGRFLAYQPRIVGDVQCREGLMRPLMWAALFRNWTLRDWMTLAELAWKPWRTGKYAKNSDQKDIDNLLACLEAMTASGICVYPDNTEVEIHWPGNSTKGTSSHKELFDAMGAEMSKATIGQTETTQASSSSGYAQAKVQNEVRKDIRDACARRVAACIRKFLIAPLVFLNFGPEAEVPEFKFLTEDEVDGVAFSTMLLNVCNPIVGLKVSSAWVRDRLGMPEPEEDEECVGGGIPEPAEDIPIDPATGLPAEPKPNDDKPQEEEPKEAA